MRGVSTLIGVVLLLLVVIAATSVLAVVLRGMTIWPRTVPRAYLCLMDFYAEEDQTKLMVWHQGGEILRSSEVLVILEGILKEGGEKRVENVFSTWCPSEVLGAGKFILSVPYVFETIERLMIVHKPSGATILYFSSPVSIRQ